MPSPFPGMDPYIEASGKWSGFHAGMIVAIRALLNAKLPKRFVADVDDYVLIHEPGVQRPRRVAPDVYVAESGTGTSKAEGTVLLATRHTTPIVFPVVERRKHRRVRIIDRESQDVVTALEVLSPSNKKAGPDRDQYLLKRKEYFAGRVSLVEVDLLRGGKRLPLGKPATEVRDFCVMVCRGWEYPRADLLTFSLREKFPVISVPLTEELPAIDLDLRHGLDRVYEEARYNSALHYDQPLKPRVNKSDSAWVRERLAARSE